MRRLWIAIFLSLAACRGSDAGGSLPAGTHRRQLEYEGRTRSYLVHVPPRSDGGEPLPVVLNFHGGGGNAQGQERYSGMDALADEAGFIVVYPDGTGRFPGILLTWNAGSCCGYARDQDVDDVGFVRELLIDLGSSTPIDLRRVYATGLSNGAMMAYRLAAEAPDVVAAIAPVGGAMALDPLQAEAPVPVLHIHSVDDPRALYDGGLGPPFPLTTQRVDHLAVESVLEFWAANNGCTSEPRETEARQSMPDPDGPVHTARRLTFAPCTSGAEVVHWKLSGAGHVWPGGQLEYLTSLLGPGTDVIDANEEAWSFFEGFALEAPG